LPSFSEQQLISWPALDFSPQQAAEALSFLAHAFPSFLAQQEDASLLEQQDAASFPSFVVAACMQCCACSLLSAFACEAIFLQQEHLLSAAGAFFSVAGGCVEVAVCAHAEIVKARNKAKNLVFMISFSVYECCGTHGLGSNSFIHATLKLKVR